MTDPSPSRRLEGRFSAERAKAFVDAVVAISTMLSILALVLLVPSVGWMFVLFLTGPLHSLLLRFVPAAPSP